MSRPAGRFSRRIARARAREMQLHGPETMEQPFQKQSGFDETIDALRRERDDADIAGPRTEPIEERNLLIQLQPRGVEQQHRSTTIEWKVQRPRQRTEPDR